MLALIAGRGALPAAVAVALEATGTPFLVAAVKDNEPDALARPVDLEADVNDLGTFFAALKGLGVTSVAMAGAVTRPDSVDNAVSPDGQRGGDDALLRTIIALFEEQGIRVRAIHEIAPGMLPAPGTIGPAKPSPEDIRDAARAETIQRTIGALDIGQACAVRAGQALAIETRYGTQAMLQTLATLRQGETGGIFYKAPKPEQDRRVDLPVIGPDTVDQVAGAGLSGLVIEAGGVMVLDQPEVAVRLAAHGLFLWIRPRGHAA